MNALLGVLSRTLGGAGCVALLIGAAGCSMGFHSRARPSQIYFLRAEPGPDRDGMAQPTHGTSPRANGMTGLPPGPPPEQARLQSDTASGVSLHVARPVAGPGLDTDHLVLVQSDHRMSYFAASSWPAVLPDVVESLAVQTLRASRAWKSVQDSSSIFPSDDVLQIVIRRFEADYTGGASAPTVHVVFDCTVGRRPGREVIASYEAQGTAAAAANRLGDVVSAFERAANAALRSMAARAARATQDQAAQNVAMPVPSNTR